MKPPLRLIERGGISRSLLESVRGDVPTREGKERARAAGLAAVGAGTGASAALVAGSTKAAGKAAALVALKWIVVVAVPIAAVTASYQALRSAETPRPTPSAALVPSGTSAGPGRAGPDPATLAGEAPALPAEVASPADRTAVTMPSAHRKVASLEEQISALDAARHALDRGDSALLDRFLSTYARGAMYEQALWLKIQHLRDSGRTAEAKARARELLSAYPRSTYAEGARRILEQ
jgi:hypothetical protein